jgi:hypothetical protein
VEDHIDVVDQTIDKVKVHHRTIDEIKIGGMIVACPDIVGGTSGQIIEDYDPMSVFEEEFGQIAADESCPAGD